MWFWYVITLHYRILVRWFWEQFGIIVIEMHDKQTAEVHHENMPLSSDWAGDAHTLMLWKWPKITNDSRMSKIFPYLLIQF